MRLNGLKVNAMLENNICYIASAGAGKTRKIIELVESSIHTLDSHKKIVIITFTTNNQNVIKERVFNWFGYFPDKIIVMGWYEFLLTHWIRPYKGDVITKLYDEHVGLLMVDGQSGLRANPKTKTYSRTYRKGDLEKKYLSGSSNKIYSDKLAEFAIECYKNNIEALTQRLQNIFQYVFIDECQDLAGYDFEVIKVLLEQAQIKCCLVTDPRQCTYVTNQGSKHKQFRGRVDEFIRNKINTKRKQYAILDYESLTTSHRSAAEICDFASILTPEYPATIACECVDCGLTKQAYPKKKGCFLLKEKDVDDYIKEYSPLALTWNIKKKISPLIKNRMNYGDSKGKEYDSSIIYPTNPIINWLKNNSLELPDEARAKFYVALTRARFIAAIVVPNAFRNNKSGLPFWGEQKHQPIPAQLSLFDENTFL